MSGSRTAAVLLSVLALTGCSGGHKVSGTIKITGLTGITAHDDYRLNDDGSCEAFDPLVVRNGDGDTIATKRLGTGKPDKVSTRGGVTASVNCTIDYSLSLDDAKFYEFEIGNGGTYKTSREDLAANDWKLDLQLSGS